MVLLTLTNETQNISTTSFGPVAAAMVISTPIVLICSVGGLMIHHKLSSVKAKKLAIELEDESWMIQDPTPAKKNTARRSNSGQATISKKKGSPVKAKSSEKEIVDRGTEVDEEEIEEEMEEVIPVTQEKTKEEKEEAKKKAKKARKARKAAAKAAEKNKVAQIEEEVLEYTKGVPRNKKGVAVMEPKGKEDLRMAITEIFQDRVLEEVLYKRDWKVVGKKGVVVEQTMEEIIQSIEEEMQVEKAVEAESIEEEESVETSEDVSHTTKALTPPELQEMAREGREEVEELVWFADDEDFRL